MLIEKGLKAYISDKVEDGVVKKATHYIFLNGRCTRVGESVDIKKPYKTIKKHNLIARHSFIGEYEEPEEVVVEDETEEVVEVVENVNEEETVEVETGDEDETESEKYSFMDLKQMNGAAQKEICKSMGLKGYHNMVEDDRIQLILDNQ